MEVKPDSSEERIIAAAREVFRRKGFSGARMEEIAIEAGINKAMLHYYYRSKEKLFRQVFMGSFKGFFIRLVEILNSDIPLDAKIYKLVDYYTSFLLVNRDLPIFILSEIRFQDPEFFEQMKQVSGFSFSGLDDQLQREHKRGTIRKTNAISFFQNLVGLTVFPFISEPLIKHMADLSDEDFKEFVKSRRKEIPEIIISYLRPDSNENN